ncbi:uncharacterized protein LOC111711878 [Eurytemora carolleeae]|uniref:uncharacterized protein LOC111711878 n=1 Tax=Eurytemora carolleeae TaxID=1294199 RepID=UPI000C763F58|nr:uncharacterized protein LOC111711878 [Eurytemora carolleeae]|eukprot:XP_023342104.1 uncharacterized protein LOC111711878 [Eurytemora affinis]
MNMKIVLVLALVAVCAHAATYNRALLGAEEDEKEFEKEVSGVIDSLWGGICVTDSSCLEYVSYCHRETSISVTGQCRLIWYSWLVLGLAALLILSALVACICCPCCFLYACCSGILDCLCGCCRTKGYSPANRS